MRTTRTAYAGIAAELRARIEAGELAPGDRVPSAREISRRWGVAIATATRVLAALRDQGLVRAQPGVGTVVLPTRPAGPPTTPGAARSGAPDPTSPSGPPPSPPQPSPPQPPPRRAPAGADAGLSTARIVAAALAVADAEGLAGLSMRRVASDLGAAPMSLYRHVADKDDLLERMMDAALGEWAPPARPPAGWRPRLELAAHGLWAVFRRHPWLAPALSLTRPQPIPAGIRLTEWVLDALDGHGVHPAAAFEAHLVVFTYVRGTAVNLEPEAEAEAVTGLSADAWTDSREPALRAVLGDGPFPRFRRLLAAGYAFDLDALFRRGLDLLLDGLEGQLCAAAPAPRPPLPRATTPP